MERRLDGPEKDYLTLEEVCEYLRLEERTVRRLREAGRFPEPTRPGGPGRPTWAWLTIVAWGHLYGLLPCFREPLPRLTRKSKREKSNEES